MRFVVQWYHGLRLLLCAGLAPEIPLTVVYASDYSLLKYTQTLGDMDSPPLVNSVSYGLAHRLTCERTLALTNPLGNASSNQPVSER